MQREETIACSNLMHFQMHFQNKPNVRNAWGLQDQLHGAQSVLKQINPYPANVENRVSS